jgi:hypothetical protein
MGASRRRRAVRCRRVIPYSNAGIGGVTGVRFKDTLETLAPICCSDSSRFSHAQAREEATTILRSRSKKPDKLRWHKSWLDGRESSAQRRGRARATGTRWQ